MMESSITNKRRDIIIVAIGQGLQALITVVSIRLMTSWLSPSEIGRYYIFLSLTAFFALFLINPIGIYINRETHNWYGYGTLKRNLNLYWLFLLGVAIFAFVVLQLIKITVGIGIEVTWYWLGIVVMGILLFGTANVTIITILNMLGNRIWFTIFSLLTLLAGLGSSFFFTQKISAQAEYWLVGLILGQILIFVLSYRFLINRLKLVNDVHEARFLETPRIDSVLTMMKFCWPLAITAGLSWVQSLSYRFIIASSAGIAELGLFAVGFGIGSAVMGVFSGIFNLYYYPIYYKEISTEYLMGRKLSWNKFAAYLFPAAIMMTVFVIVCAPYLTKLLVASEFKDCQKFILWGALTQLAVLLGNGFQMLAQAEMKTNWLISTSITGAIVALGGVFILAKWDVQIGTGIALTLAGFAMVIHLYIKLHKKVTFNLPYRRIFISLALSVPFIVVLLVFVNPIMGQPSYLKAIMVLLVAGSYLLIIQYLMATRWIKENAI